MFRSLRPVQDTKSVAVILTQIVIPERAGRLDLQASIHISRRTRCSREPDLNLDCRPFLYWWRLPC